MDITNVLDLIKHEIEAINPVEEKYLRSNGNDNGFERLFAQIADQVAAHIAPTDELIVFPHWGHHFPDVDFTLNGVKYGVELKSRKDGSWKTNGNSVFESISSEEYEDILLVFASKVPNENRLLIKFAPYWQTTSAIKVTHSPRFAIDINNLEHSVFETKAQYDELRSMSNKEKVDFVQKQLRKNSAGAEWYVSSPDTITPTKFSKLPTFTQNKIQSELLILFPYDLLCGPGKTKYKRSTEYILNIHYVYNNALRDLFSSGGVYKYKEVEFPKMIETFIIFRDLIRETLDDASVDFMALTKECWKEDISSDLITDDIFTSYSNVLDSFEKKAILSPLIKSKGYNDLSELVEMAGFKSLSDFIFNSPYPY